MPFLNLEALTGSGMITFIAIIIIAIQIAYLAFKMIRTHEKYGELTWRGVGKALIPVKTPEKIFDGFVALVIVVDLLRAVFARDGLPISAVLFATVLILFVAGNSLERYRSSMEDHEVVTLRFKVTVMQMHIDKLKQQNEILKLEIEAMRQEIADLKAKGL